MTTDIQVAHAYTRQLGRSGLAAPSDPPQRMAAYDKEQEPASRSPICPSCGHNVVQPPHRSNKGSMLICCRGWLAQINADRAKKQS